jgi:hypothetical protein
MELEPRTQAPAHATGAVEFIPLSAIDGDATFRVREEGDVSALAASLGRLGQLVAVEVRLLTGPSGGAPRYQIVSGFRRIAALRLLRRERALARVHAFFSDEDAWGLALSQALLTEPLDRSAVEALRARLEPSGVAPWALELLDEALVRAPVEPEFRERFYDFLTTPEGPAQPLAPGLSRRGLDGGAAPDEAAELAADVGREDAVGDETPGPDGAETETEDGAALDAEAGADEDGEVDDGEAVEVTPEELATDLARRMYEVNADLAVAWDAWADVPPEGRAAIVEQARWIAELLPSLEEDVEE